MKSISGSNKKTVSAGNETWRDRENKWLQFDIMNPRRCGSLTEQQTKEKMIYAMACDKYSIRMLQHFARQYHISDWFYSEKGFADEFRKKYPGLDPIGNVLKTVKGEAAKVKDSPPFRTGMQIGCAVSIGIHSDDVSSYFYKFDQKVNIQDEEVASNYNSLIVAMDQWAPSNKQNTGAPACEHKWLPSILDILNPTSAGFTAVSVKNMIASAILSGGTVLEIARYFAIQHDILDWFSTPSGLAKEIGKVSTARAKSFKSQLAAFEDEYYPRAREGTRLSWKIEISCKGTPSYHLETWNIIIQDKQMADAYSSLFSIMERQGSEINGFSGI